MLKKLLPYLFLTFVYALITYIGFRPEWYEQLPGDSKYYFSITSYFWNNLTLLNFNDALLYPPAANLYFFLLSLSKFWNTSFEGFQTALVVSNYLLVLLLWKSYANKDSLIKRFIIYILILLAAGPIIVFRFDLLVVLMTVLSIKFMLKNNFILSGLFLGLATSLKIFPVVLLPYFLLIIFSQQKFTSLVKFLLTYLAAIIAILIIYSLLTGQNFIAIYEGFNFNLSKAVHIESTIGTLLTSINLVLQPHLRGIDFQNGVFVLPPIYTLGHVRIYRYFTILGLMLIYAFILFFKKYKTMFNVQTCMVIILTLLIFNQVISPQYLLWPFLLIPLLDKNELRSRLWKFSLPVVLLILLCTQYVYPLRYIQLIFGFYGSGHDTEVFIVLTARNILLVFQTLAIFFSLVFVTKKLEPEVTPSKNKIKSKIS